MGASKVRKTFTIRSPFIIFNKTDTIYMLKIVRHGSNDERIMKLAPGDGYPLSHSEIKSKIMFANH